MLERAKTSLLPSVVKVDSGHVAVGPVSGHHSRDHAVRVIGERSVLVTKYKIGILSSVLIIYIHYQNYNFAKPNSLIKI